MRSLLIFYTITVAAVVNADIFSTKEEALVRNETWLTSFRDCLLKTAPCDEDMKLYADVIPGYVKTSCSQCSQLEKEYFEKYRKTLSALYPDLYREIISAFKSLSK